MWQPGETGKRIVELIRAGDPGLMDEIVATLRSEARFRPTIWGDARPLLIAAADEIERLHRALDIAVSRGCTHCADSLRAARSEAGLWSHSNPSN